MNPALADQITSFEREESVNGDASANDSAGFLLMARSLIASLDQYPSTPTQLGPARWLNLVDKLQMIAYYDPDRGGETDIALWCERQWATALQSESDNITALQGRSLSSNSSQEIPCMEWHVLTYLQALVVHGY